MGRGVDTTSEDTVQTETWYFEGSGVITQRTFWIAFWSVAAFVGGADSLFAQNRQTTYLPPPVSAMRPYAAGARHSNEMRAANPLERHDRLAMRSQPPVSGSFASQIRRLPPIRPQQRPNALNAQAVDGTWQDVGGQIIINFNGQQLRLEKTGDEPAPKPYAPPGGEVYGRLSHKGRPVANCRVALLPLKKDWSGYRVDGSVAPTVGTTDSDGIYRIEDVASGPYKLTWLPDGERQWIRRIEIRPDVNVKSGDIAHIKEIRKSLRTVN